MKKFQLQQIGSLCGHQQQYKLMTQHSFLRSLWRNSLLFQGIRFKGKYEIRRELRTTIDEVLKL